MRGLRVLLLPTPGKPGSFVIGSANSPTDLVESFKGNMYSPLVLSLPREDKIKDSALDSITNYYSF